DHFGRDVAGGARPIFDHEALAEPIGEPLTEQTGDDVVSAAGRKPDDQAHRSRRKGLRPGDARHHRQSRRSRRKLEKWPADKFHEVAPGLWAKDRASCSARLKPMPSWRRARHETQPRRVGSRPARWQPGITEWEATDETATARGVHRRRH